MGSITSFNSKRVQKLLKKEQEEKKEKEAAFSKNKTKKIIYCSFCGSLAAFFAIRKKDAKKIPCCRTCVSLTTKKMTWILSVEEF